MSKVIEEPCSFPWPVLDEVVYVIAKSLFHSAIATVECSSEVLH
jgi:hypothetical protein